ncbi:MAG: imidazole glycerol phosphate synthase subunit HisH [Kiloniellaceae bacterium]
MIVAIIDYGSGNLRSAAKAFERAAAEAGLAAEAVVTSAPETLVRAERIVLPGVGAFGDCRKGLAALPGMIEALEDAVTREGRPFLGICVGMQLMASVSREHGMHQGLDWIAGEVVALEPNESALELPHMARVPHMGWNALEIADSGHPVLAGLAQGPHVYFVHSYHFRPNDPGHILATADYGGAVTAAVGRDNLIGTQFHPEKSQAAGLALLTNFLRWRP